MISNITEYFNNQIKCESIDITSEIIEAGIDTFLDDGFIKKMYH